ncbi:MAG: 23S rRNA (adenine(2503)-C(2))-methyltransferase RlmN [Oscillospiraceae bacterium]|nr:23S rRNA (adenine(2503)-C(2))-methyltransferase RlmN [Oscillospiraceae bacterium]
MNSQIEKNKKIDVLSLELHELERETELSGIQKFRAKQVFEWLHLKKATQFDEMTNISAQMRAVFGDKFYINLLKIQKRLESNRRDTVKYLYELQDGNRIETVLMRHRDRNSLCVSSQAGCRMGCRFCASTVAGFGRNLTPSEMLLQLYETLRDGNTVDSIVIMGIGEPLDNFSATLKFLELLRSAHGMSLRRVSLSTCGLADKIDELAGLKLGVTLSVSLHAASDEERSEIMPINRRFGIERLLESCRGYFTATSRRISFEYALISGVNDSEIHAGRLAGLLLKKMPRGSFHVNLIPVNEVNETPFKKSGNARIFADVLVKSGVNATIRRTMGGDISAACGQLRAEN